MSKIHLPKPIYPSSFILAKISIKDVFITSFLGFFDQFGKINSFLVIFNRLCYNAKNFYLF
ncbi:hypothetical protein A9309_04370 [Moraxella lacunata]|uniref:Uncharacterized protein n=1 Tax=Moraxella lacunata TaxID=477 RepID=A0A1B8Q4Y9_MORLA|nr:hypothetical protein A9309_04370 [Moraxella lacunata]